MNEKITFLQGAVEGRRSGAGARKFGILESKAILGIKPLGADKGCFDYGMKSY